MAAVAGIPSRKGVREYAFFRYSDNDTAGRALAALQVNTNPSVFLVANSSLKATNIQANPSLTALPAAFLAAKWLQL